MSSASARVSVNVIGGGLQAPAQAAAAGFTRLVYREEFDDTSGIDMANSGAAGFNIYRKYAFGGTVISTSNFSVSNSVCTIGWDTGGHHCGFMSAHVNGSGGYWGNGIFTGGGYFEARISWDVSGNHTGDGQRWPMWFMMSLEQFFNEAKAPYPTLEIDIFEYDFPQPDYNKALDCSCHKWTSPSTYQTIVGGNTLWPAGADFNQLGTVGLLWVPGDRMDHFYDDVLLRSDTYGSPDNFAAQGIGVSDNMPMAFHITGADTQPLSIDWIRAWQAP
jgi:hypothetical protein